eukprot:TRINITY_DN12626_c0_g1_i1.p1 TRINITY_DN12626_c0_g1~~TRINITY_DN12626_c0_g1_i1.p1  ORF type:complete len:254 (+),score=43.76 TRINITY_DN12626_c0_g1_i1:140-901(+)
MDSLPDELLLLIFEHGIRRDTLNYRDLASLAISSRRLCRLSSLDRLWDLLWRKDFPSDKHPSSPDSAVKLRYRRKCEIVQSKKVASHRRLVLRVQSEALVLEKECRDFESKLSEEKARLTSALAELKNLERARESSVAVKAWQPYAVQLGQQKILEQTPVPTHSRIESLKMEVAVCKEHISRFNKNILKRKNMLEKVKKELDALTYKPLQQFSDKSCSAHPGEVKMNQRTTKASKQKGSDSLNINSVQRDNLF